MSPPTPPPFIVALAGALHSAIEVYDRLRATEAENIRIVEINGQLLTKNAELEAENAKLKGDGAP